MHRKNANQPCAWTGGSSSENRMSASNKVIGNDVSEKRKFRTDSQVVMLPLHSKMRTKFSERSIPESLKGNFCQKRPTNQIALEVLICSRLGATTINRRNIHRLGKKRTIIELFKVTKIHRHTNVSWRSFTKTWITHMGMIHLVLTPFTT